jgi:hypothetical protein
MAPANANSSAAQNIQVAANDKPVKDSAGVPALNATDSKPTSKLSELDIAELKYVIESFADYCSELSAGSRRSSLARTVSSCARPAGN